MWSGEPVQLRPLSEAELPSYLALWRGNAAYLGTADGMARRSDEDMAREVLSTDALNPHFGIWVGDLLVGRIDLVPVSPPIFSVGYWVAEERAGRGHATQAVRLAVEHAREHLGATDIYAGVRHGNAASRRVLDKAGFVLVSDQGTYLRFHRPLDGGPPRDPAHRPEV